MKKIKNEKHVHVWFPRKQWTEFLNSGKEHQLHARGLDWKKSVDRWKQDMSQNHLWIDVVLPIKINNAWLFNKKIKSIEKIKRNQEEKTIHEFMKDLQLEWEKRELIKKQWDEESSLKKHLSSFQWMVKKTCHRFLKETKIIKKALQPQWIRPDAWNVKEQLSYKVNDIQWSGNHWQYEAKSAEMDINALTHTDEKTRQWTLHHEYGHLVEIHVAKHEKWWIEHWNEWGQKLNPEIIKHPQKEALPWKVINEFNGNWSKNKESQVVQWINTQNPLTKDVKNNLKEQLQWTGQWIVNIETWLPLIDEKTDWNWREWKSECFADLWSLLSMTMVELQKKHEQIQLPKDPWNHPQWKKDWIEEWKRQAIDIHLFRLKTKKIEKRRPILEWSLKLKEQDGVFNEKQKKDYEQWFMEINGAWSHDTTTAMECALNFFEKSPSIEELNEIIKINATEHEPWIQMIEVCIHKAFKKHWAKTEWIDSNQHHIKNSAYSWSRGQWLGVHLRKEKDSQEEPSNQEKDNETVEPLNWEKSVLDKETVLDELLQNNQNNEWKNWMRYIHTKERAMNIEYFDDIINPWKDASYVNKIKETTKKQRQQEFELMKNLDKESSKNRLDLKDMEVVFSTEEKNWEQFAFTQLQEKMQSMGPLSDIEKRWVELNIGPWVKDWNQAWERNENPMTIQAWMALQKGLWMQTIKEYQNSPCWSWNVFLKEKEMEPTWQKKFMSKYDIAMDKNRAALKI